MEKGCLHGQGWCLHIWEGGCDDGVYGRGMGRRMCEDGVYGRGMGRRMCEDGVYGRGMGRRV